MPHINHDTNNPFYHCPTRERQAFVDRICATAESDQLPELTLPAEPLMENGEWIEDKAGRLDLMRSAWPHPTERLSPNCLSPRLHGLAAEFILNSQLAPLHSLLPGPSP